MENTIIEVYKGIKIRRYNQIILRVNTYEFKKFIDYKEDNQLSARDVIEASSKPCSCCRDSMVIIHNKKDQSIEVKRGLLCKRKK